MINGEFIYNETLSGAVDGVNTEFTTLNSIDKLEEVYLGGAAFRDVTFLGNVITFSLAPPTGTAQPSADYFLAPIPSSAPSDDVTWKELRKETTDILGTDDTSPVFTKEIVERYLNKGLQKIKNEKFFKEKISSFTFNKAIDRNAIGFDANTITIADTPFIPSSGALLLGDTAFVEYSTFTNGVFGAAAGFVYESGDKVSVGYKIPSGVKKVAEVMLGGVPLVYLEMREYAISRNRKHFTIFHAANGDQFIFLPFMDDTPITVRFVTEHVIYSLDTDIVDILFEYTDAIALYSAYKAALFREDDRWQAFKVEYIEEKNRLKAFKARQTDGINNEIPNKPLFAKVRTGRLVRFDANVTTTP